MSAGYQEICAFLYREARLLDDRQWDEWLACYHDDVEFWMPAWTDDDELIVDPQSQISLIFYPDRKGLEDRVYRIRTERSSATMPEARTSHAVNNVEVLEQRRDEVDVRFNWHTLSHRTQRTTSFFGTSFYTLDFSQGTPLITKKKIVLKNDYINQVIDVYHI